MGRDARFLRDWRIMDYSLLVGIQNVTERRVFHPAPQHAAPQPPAPQRGGGAPPLRSSSSSSAASISAALDAAGGSSVVGSSVVVQAEGAQQCGPLGFSAETLQGPGHYRLGIIDPLQRWGMRKRLERLLKIVVRALAPTRAPTLAPTLAPTRALALTWPSCPLPR